MTMPVSLSLSKIKTCEAHPQVWQRLTQEPLQHQSLLQTREFRQVAAVFGVNLRVDLVLLICANWTYVFGASAACAHEVKPAA